MGGIWVWILSILGGSLAAGYKKRHKGGDNIEKKVINPMLAKIKTVVAFLGHFF